MSHGTWRRIVDLEAASRRRDFDAYLCIHRGLVAALCRGSWPTAMAPWEREMLAENAILVTLLHWASLRDPRKGHAYLKRNLRHTERDLESATGEARTVRQAGREIVHVEILPELRRRRDYRFPLDSHPEFRELSRRRDHARDHLVLDVAELVAGVKE